MMEKIYELIEHMEEEIESAQEYAHKAIMCASHRDKANAYLEMAEDELSHYTKLEGMLKDHLKTIDGDLKAFAEKMHIALTDKFSSVKHLIKKAGEN